MSRTSPTEQQTTNLHHLSVHRTTHPSTSYLSFQITFPKSTPFYDQSTGARITPPKSTPFQLDQPTLSSLISAAISQLYGYIGSVTIKYTIATINPATGTFILSADNAMTNSLRAAMTYLTTFQNTQISINLVAQSITLDQTHLPQDWYSDLLE